MLLRALRFTAHHVDMRLDRVAPLPYSLLMTTNTNDTTTAPATPVQHDHYIVLRGGGTRWSTASECTKCGTGRAL